MKPRRTILPSLAERAINNYSRSTLNIERAPIKVEVKVVPKIIKKPKLVGTTNEVVVITTIIYFVGNKFAVNDSLLDSYDLSSIVDINTLTNTVSNFVLRNYGNNLYWVSQNSGGDFLSHVRYSPDLGLTISELTNPTSGSANAMDVSLTGRLFVTFTGSSPGIYYSDDNFIWTLALSMPSNRVQSAYVKCSLTDANKLAVLDFYRSPTYEIHLRVSLDAGLSWSDLELMPAFGFDTFEGVDDGLYEGLWPLWLTTGRLIMMYQERVGNLHFAYSDDDGASATDQVLLDSSTSPHFGEDLVFGMWADSNDNIYIGVRTGSGDTFFLRSVDLGITFEFCTWFDTGFTDNHLPGGVCFVGTDMYVLTETGQILYKIPSADTVNASSFDAAAEVISDLSGNYSSFEIDSMISVTQ